MRLLAIDSATEFCSVALCVDADKGESMQVWSRGEELPRQHSQALLPFVNELLTEAGVSLNELDGIVVSQGPGSFTGVRIGASIAQGLAFSQNLPLVQVSTLAAMAQACSRLHGATQVAAAIDARMGEVYFGTYQLVNGLMVVQGEEMVCPPTHARLAAFAPLDEPKVGEANASAEEGIGTHNVATCGTGWEAYPEQLEAALAGVSLQHTDVRLPHARDMLTLAVPEFAAGNSINAVDLSPNYLRNEVTWQKLPGR